MKKNYLVAKVLFLLVSSFLVIYFFKTLINLQKGNYLELEKLGLRNFPAAEQIKISKILNEKKRELTIKNIIDNKYSPLYFSIKNIGKNTVEPTIIVNNKNWSSNKAILKSALANSSSLSEEEKALRLTSYLHNNLYYFPAAYYHYSELDNPVTSLNFFGYGYCSQFSYSLAILAELAGSPSRVVYLVDHVVTEIYYDGSWHMFDADLGVFFRNSNGEIASVEDIFRNLALLKQQPQVEEFLLPIFSNKKIKDIDVTESFFKEEVDNKLEYRLQPKEEILFFYNWKGDWFWENSDDEPSDHTNGLLVSNLRQTIFDNDQYLVIKLPYPILTSYLYGHGINPCYNADKVLFSLDGASWQDVKKYCHNNIIKLTDVFPKGKKSEITYKYFLKTRGRQLFMDYTVYTQFQVATNSIPRLQAGANKVQLENVNNDGVELKFAYRKN